MACALEQENKAECKYYFNLSADTVIYPDKNLNNSTYQKLQRHLLQCDEKQLKTLLAITEAVLSVDDTRTDNSDI